MFLLRNLTNYKHLKQYIKNLIILRLIVSLNLNQVTIFGYTYAPYQFRMMKFF